MPPLNGQMPQQDPLAQLKDIHLPEAISAWPPAPGWWILAVMLLSLLIWGCIWFIQRHKQNRYRQQALLELQQLNDQGTALTNINALLKRVALVAYPDQQVASLNGEQWVSFLHRCCPQVTDGSFALLAQGPYQDPGKISDSDIKTLQNHCSTWIKKHGPIAPFQAKPEVEAV